MKNESAPPIVWDNGSQSGLNEGLTKLEWFAGMAMQVLLSTTNAIEGLDARQVTSLAEDAFIHAAVMLKESEKRQGGQID